MISQIQNMGSSVKQLAWSLQKVSVIKEKKLVEKNWPRIKRHNNYNAKSET